MMVVVKKDANSKSDRYNKLEHHDRMDLMYQEL